MGSPQRGIFEEGAPHTQFLEFQVTGDAETERVRDTIAAALGRDGQGDSISLSASESLSGATWHRSACLRG